MSLLKVCFRRVIGKMFPLMELQIFSSICHYLSLSKAEHQLHFPFYLFKLFKAAQSLDFRQQKGQVVTI